MTEPEFAISDHDKWFSEKLQKLIFGDQAGVFVSHYKIYAQNILLISGNLKLEKRDITRTREGQFNLSICVHCRR